ncbi:Zinc finger CCHC-type [Arabidopsis suecica]|uniref:Zinc finger CCHC-type n=1 Tax=Arabidopsis suecica TaxID=45249 RepID=A0A8T2FXC5_ARASU|nr:Zinc finger CCHC-type [Arabidopsis suecica]
MNSASVLTQGKETEVGPKVVVVDSSNVNSVPDPRWPYLTRWTQNSPSPSPSVISPSISLVKPLTIGSSLKIARSSSLDFVNLTSSLDSTLPVTVEPPIEHVVSITSLSYSTEVSLPTSALPPIVSATLDESIAPIKLVSPTLKGAWAKQLKFTSSSASQQDVGGAPMQSHLEATKEDNVRFPWAAKMDPAARNLYRATSPEFMEDGTPKVTIPSHVFLQGLVNQKEYVLGQFYRCSPPPGGLIHARGLWHVDDCLMFVAPWSTADTFDLSEISTIPVWVTLKNIPNRLYSIPGISHIASGLGAPMATYKPRLDPSLMSEANILVEVELSKAFPPRIAAVDKKENISMVNIEYAWIPAKCGKCGQLGHKASRCMKPHLAHEKVTEIVSEEIITPAIVSLASATNLVSPITLQTKTPIDVPITDSKIQIDTVFDIEAGPIQDKDNCTGVADCFTNVEAKVVTEETCTVESVFKIAGTKDNVILNEDSIVSVESDSGSELMEHMTPSGQRLLRERPVKPSIKAKEIQASSTTRGRGNRGRGNRGRGNRGRGNRGRG